MSFEEFSSELLANLATYMPCEALMRFSQTSKHFYAVISKESFWSNLYLAKNIKLSEDQLVKFHSYKLFYKICNKAHVFKFRVTETRGGCMPQLKAIRFIGESNTIAPQKIMSAYPNPGEPESASNLVRGGHSKWYSGQNNPKLESKHPFPFNEIDVSVFFEFPKSTYISSYELTTANDCPARDPVEWTWSVGVDKTNTGEWVPAKSLKAKEWLEIDKKLCRNLTNDRYAKYPEFELPIFAHKQAESA